MQVNVKNVSVNFQINDVNYRSLKKSLITALATTVRSKNNVAFTDDKKVLVNSLSRINFKAEENDRVGIIGLNGSGKTTLLKIISGIIPPSSGLVEIEGALASFIDITSGMDLNLSGRENAILKGMYMGVPPELMKAKIGYIEKFSDLGEFFELPVSSYSSGMVVRLAFSIATSVKPDILVLDEWLSAGDASFVKKMEEKMSNYVNSASILILATHSPSIIKEWCNKVMVLDAGRLVFYGAPNEALSIYNKIAENNI